jgi:Flp pilus assembly protein protease CpaA
LSVELLSVRQPSAHLRTLMINTIVIALVLVLVILLLPTASFNIIHQGKPPVLTGGFGYGGGDSGGGD